MRPSRGMGCINPAKQPRTIKKRDGNEPVKLFKEGGAVKKFADGGALGDDEGRLAKFRNLTPSEKAKIRSEQQAELSEATSNRKRPLSSRVVDKLYESLGNPTTQELTAKTAAEDTARRQTRYDDAKRRAAMSDEELDKEKRLYGVDRKVKLADNPHGMKNGGAVGLYANIHAKQQRIAKGSGEKMRKPGTKGAPTAQAFKRSALTAK